MNAPATTTSPKDVFTRYFAELERRSIPYVILHSYDRYPDEIPTDVDFAVMEANRHDALSAIWETAQSCGWIVAQHFEYEICASSVLLVAPNEPASNIRLDVTSHFTRNGCFYLTDRFLSEGHSRHKDFFVPARAAEFSYILVKALAKNKDGAGALPRLRELYSHDRQNIRAAFADIFGPEAGPIEDWLDRPTNDWTQLRRQLDARHRFSPGQQFAECGRLWRRIRRPAGVRIAILGPDGIGKSALIAGLEHLLKPCFHRQDVYHFCPLLFRARDSAVVTRPHDQEPRNIVVSNLKVLYYFVDHWAGFVFQQWPAIIRRHCVVFDRNFDDLLIDPRRYRLCGATWLVRLLRPLLPCFDLTIVLDAEPAVVHRRKTELPVEELQRQRDALRAMAAGNARFVVVPAQDTAGNVARNVAGKVIEFMAERERRRR